MTVMADKRATYVDWLPPSGFMLHVTSSPSNKLKTIWTRLSFARSYFFTFLCIFHWGGFAPQPPHSQSSFGLPFPNICFSDGIPVDFCRSWGGPPQFGDVIPPEWCRLWGDPPWATESPWDSVAHRGGGSPPMSDGILAGEEPRGRYFGCGKSMGRYFGWRKNLRACTFCNFDIQTLYF